MSLAVITPAYYPNEERFLLLKWSCELHKIPLFPFGVGEQWPGDAIGHFDGAPLAIKNLPSDVDLVLFTDAEDSFLLAGEEEIRWKFALVDAPVVLSTEQSLYPWGMDETWARNIHPVSLSPWRYVNGGGWMGSPKNLLRVLEEAKAQEWPEAQGKWIMQYVKDGAIKLDSECRIFQTMSGPLCDNVKIRKPRVVNIITGQEPCVLHYNGHSGGAPAAYKVIYDS